jgi:nicotinate-nucleotide adenylyltransferase
MQQTGLLFGSFNPPHIGHLAVANYLCEYRQLEEVWWVVTPQNPLKEPHQPAGARHRLEMVRLAVAPYPAFRVCDVEFSLPSPAYTVNTLRTLRERYPLRDFQLIIGSDNWQQLPLWKGFQEILAEFTLLVYPRFGYELPPPAATAYSDCLLQQSLSAGDFPAVHFVPAPRLEISATFIREALAQGRRLGCFMPPAVAEYIKANKLYFPAP